MRRVAILSLVVVALASCTRGANAPSDTGIRGVVLLGPSCPVVQATSPCPDEPMGDTKVEVTREGDVIATAISDAEGRFEVAVPAGEYVVQAVLDAPGPPSAKPVPVSVRSGRFAQVQVLVDTGIR